MKLIKILPLTLILIIFTDICSFNQIFVTAASSGTKTQLAEYTFEENGFENWSPLGGQSKLSIDHKRSHKGNSSLKVSDREKTWSGPSLNITDYAKPGETLYFEAEVVCEDKNDTVSLSIKYSDDSGIDSYDTAASVEANASVWSYMSGEIVIPENVANAIIYFEATELDTNFYIDDVKIYSSSPAVTTEKETKKQSEYSFGFEEGNDGWISRGNALIEITDSFSYTGKFSIYVSQRAKVWHGPSVRLYKVEPGLNYTYSAYVMYNGKEYEDNHTFLIELQYNYEGKEVYDVVSRKEVQKGTWSNISGDFTLPQGATDIFFYIQTENVNDEWVTENDLMSFYVDNVTIIDSTIMNHRKLIKYFLIGISVIAFTLLLTFIMKKYIKNHLYTKQILQAASLDSMTGALNRNTFEEKMKYLELNPEKCRNLYVTICDVNYLKYINDNYGHEKGDKAIIRCASSLLKAVSNKNGEVYRTGGDEFMCLTRKNYTEEIKIQLAIESAQYDGYPFSVAVGTASYDRLHNSGVPDIKEIVTRSDKAMYIDKQEQKKITPVFTETKKDENNKQ